MRESSESVFAEATGITLEAISPPTAKKPRQAADILLGTRDPLLSY
ncbi:Hypothetical protein Cp262_2019 [Corynebacterium pseudotuberculosis]|nr:Hypothetical protein Cp262_2019 [Corynebacterium pseudotuberculosis]